MTSHDLPSSSLQDSSMETLRLSLENRAEIHVR
jgi:hypothetical protein